MNLSYNKIHTLPFHGTFFWSLNSTFQSGQLTYNIFYAYTNTYTYNTKISINVCQCSKLCECYWTEIFTHRRLCVHRSASTHQMNSMKRNKHQTNVAHTLFAFIWKLRMNVYTFFPVICLYSTYSTLWSKCKVCIFS